MDRYGYPYRPEYRLEQLVIGGSRRGNGANRHLFDVGVRVVDRAGEDDSPIRIKPGAEPKVGRRYSSEWDVHVVVRAFDV